MNKYAIILLFTAVCFISCKQIETTEPIQSTTGQPSLQTTSSGSLILSWIEEDNSQAHLKFAKYSQGEFMDTTLIASGSDWFVNWADFPAVVTNGETWFAHYLEKSDTATFAYDVKFRVSRDSGLTWSKAFKLHSDTTTTEHGFVSAIPMAEGFYVTWLDGRNTGGGGHQGHDGHQGAMSLRAAFVDSDGSVKKDLEIDNKTCDCCQTHITAVDGKPTIVYRDRLEGEIRDISWSQLEDSTWSQPMPVHNDNWQIAGCPVNGPRIISEGQNLAIAWFTGADDEGSVKIGFSDDLVSGLDKIQILENDGALGRVDLVSGLDYVLVSWIGKHEDGYAVKLARLSWSGELLKEEVLTSVDGSRHTGFPRIAILENRVFLTYTDSELHRVKVESFAF